MADFHSGLAAKEFFISRIVAAAKREGVSLSDLEQRHLYFTEVAPDAKPEYVEDAARFEEQYESDQYEHKTRDLLKKGFEFDLKHPEEFGLESAREIYRDAFDVLRKEDHYILIMVQEALGSKLKRKLFGLF